MLTCISGPAYTANPGDVIETDDAEAGRFIEAGIAEAVEPEAVEPEKKRRRGAAVETATPPKPETPEG